MPYRGLSNAGCNHVVRFDLPARAACYHEFAETKDPAMPTAMTLRVRGLGKQKMAELASKARRLGLTPQEYVKRLVEEDLAIDRAARTTTVADIVGPGRPIDEEELDRLVDEARTRHHHRVTKRR